MTDEEKAAQEALIAMVEAQDPHPSGLRWGERDVLPERRMQSVEKFHHAFDMGQNVQTYYLGVGWYNDGRVGEAFINTTKVTTPHEALVKDGAILYSIALQYGAPPKIIADAMGRRYEGEWPLSPLGAMADAILKLSQMSHHERFPPRRTLTRGEVTAREIAKDFVDALIEEEKTNAAKRKRGSVDQVPPPELRGDSGPTGGGEAPPIKP